eukprot:Tbor_TRINITY_DN6066_c0_g1::TRINITY_DN6066_c0_g1_i3::g.11026::m.11026
MFEKKDKEVIEITIFDSAPCPSVHKEIERWLKTVEENIGVKIIKFVKKTPRQNRGSNECGIHVLRNCVRFDMPEEEIKVKSLKYLRKPLEKLLKSNCVQLKTLIIKDMRGTEREFPLVEKN